MGLALTDRKVRLSPSPPLSRADFCSAWEMTQSCAADRPCSQLSADLRLVPWSVYTSVCATKPLQRERPGRVHAIVSGDSGWPVCAGHRVISEGVQLLAAHPFGARAALREHGHPEPPAHEGEELIPVKLQPECTGRHHGPPRPGTLSGHCSQPELLAARRGVR